MCSSDLDEEQGSLDIHPDWYRLRRSGNTITTYYSENGTTWRTVGAFSSSRTSWAHGDVVYLGLALTSHGGCGSSSITWGEVVLNGEVISSPGDGNKPEPGEEIETPDGICRPPSGVTINEGFFRGTDERWVELYNSGSEDVDLSGYHFTDDRNDSEKVTLGADTVIAAGGYLTFTEAELALDFSATEEDNRVFVALIEPSGGRAVDAVNFRASHDGLSEARVPDGGEMRDAAEPTRNAGNRLEVDTAIVINEIMYHPIDNDKDREFVELYNRSDDPVELTGWEFTNGIEFSFPDNTVLGAGEYLVVARDPAFLRSVYNLPEGSVYGPGGEEALHDFGSPTGRG